MKRRTNTGLAVVAAAVMLAAAVAPAWATALADNRDTPEYGQSAGARYGYTQASNVIYAGSMVAVSNGVAYPAADVAGYQVVGRAESKSDNTGSSYSAAKVVTVRRGVFRWANGDTITDAHVGDPAYVADDQTVQKGTNTQYVLAGVIVDCDSSGVWVLTGAQEGRGEAPALTGLHVKGAAAVSGALTVGGHATLAAATMSGTQTNTGAVVQSGAVTQSGNVTQSGTVTMSGTATNSGNVVQSGVLTVSGPQTNTGAMVSSGGSTLSGGVAVSGVFTKDGEAGVYSVDANDYQLYSVRVALTTDGTSTVQTISAPFLRTNEMAFSFGYLAAYLTNAYVTGVATNSFIVHGDGGVGEVSVQITGRK